MNSAVNNIKNNTVLLSALATNFPNAYISVLNKDLELEFITEPAPQSNQLELKRQIGLDIHKVFSEYEPEALKLISERYQIALEGKSVQFNLSNYDECQNHSVTPIIGSSGTTEQIICFVQNITEQKRSLEALKESESHLKMASQLAKIGYWELDIDKHLFTFNDQFLDILKVTPEDIGGYTMPISQYAEDFLIDEDAERLHAETQHAIETSDPNFSRYIEHRFIDGNGKIGYLGVRFIAVKDHNGRTIKTIGANQDITERKLAEKALKRLLHKTTDQNTRLRDFSFMTSHNIRSSVANLVGLSQLLQDEPGNLSYIDMLGITVSELDKTVKNISALLNFENASDSEIKINCNIQSAVNRFMELNATSIEQKGIKIESLLASNLSVNYVPAYLDSIIHNLLSNAIKYGTDDSSKRVEIGSPADNQSAIYVKDFGGGIDLEKYGSKLFELGSRFHSNKEGQGLGLYMTKHQIESAGGKLEVESTVNEGTTFTVFFKG